MKLIIIWANGDKEKVEIKEPFASKMKEDLVKTYKFSQMIYNESAFYNLQYARKVYFKD